MLSLKICIFLILLSTVRSDFSHLTISNDVPDNSTFKVDTSPYIKLGSKYYYFGFQYKSWMEAAAHCSNINGHLATIANGEEWQILNTYLVKNGGLSNFWISYTDQDNEGTFVSITDGSIWNLGKWASNQPDNFNNNENCVSLWSPYTFLLNDFACNQKLNFICQISSPKTICFTAW